MSVEVTEMIASFDSTLPPVQPDAGQPMATPQQEPAVPQDVLLDGVVPEDGAMCQIPRRRIRRNPASDPRKHRNRGVYEGMVESFRRDGILQPITVRPVPMDENGCDLEVVMGNTRFEGAHDAGIATLPAVVRHVDLREATIMAGVENLQRANLSPVEEGGHAASLLMKLNNDHEEVCNILGWTRKKLDSRILLTHVSEDVQNALVQNQLKLGHVELLASVPQANQSKIMRKIIDEALSVTDTRERLKKATRAIQKACFDTAQCNGCQYNSSTSADLFASTLGEGYCSNAGCWDEKVSVHIAAVAEDAKATYGTVHTDKTISADSSVTLEAYGEEGVGADQKVACAGCEHYGAIISTQYGTEAQVTGDKCFNLTCHAEKVTAYRTLIATDRQPAPTQGAAPSDGSQASAGAPQDAGTPPVASNNTAPASKAGKVEKSTQPTPATLKKGIKREAMNRFSRMGEAAIKSRPSLGLAITLMTQFTAIDSRQYSDEVRARAKAMIDSLVAEAQQCPPINEHDEGNSKAIILSRLPSKTLGPVMVQMASLTVWEEDGMDKFEKHGPTVRAMRYARVCEIKSTDYPAVNEAYLKAQNKAVIVGDCKASGFAAAYDAAKGEKAFAELAKGKAAELIAAITAFTEFEWKGYEPTGFTWEFYQTT